MKNWKEMKYNKIKIRKNNLKHENWNKKHETKNTPKKLDTTVAPPIISTDPELFWKNLTL
jgi:hypothetical protein